MALLIRVLENSRFVLGAVAARRRPPTVACQLMFPAVASGDGEVIEGVDDSWLLRWL